MKILVQNSVFHPRIIGGAEVFAQLLAVQLSERGWSVDALASTGQRAGPRKLTARPLEGATGSVYEAPACGLYDLFVPEGEAPQPGLLVRGLHHFSAVHSGRWLRLAREALDRSAPDLLHTNTIVGMTPVIWRAARERKIPIVHTLHDYHLLCPRTTLLRSDQTDCQNAPLPCRVLANLKLARTKGLQVVTAPSNFVLQRHLSVGGFPGARAEVVPNACEEIPAEIPDRTRLTEINGLYLGQLDTHKGIPELLSALTEIFAAPENQAFGFDFAGAGPLEGAVRAFCSRYPGRARFHGFVGTEAKQALLRQAAWLTLPSIWHDNFPLTLLDAFSWGLPVIGSRRGGIPEVVRDGQEGQIIEPEAWKLLEAMQRYLREPDLRIQHGKAARSRAFEYTLARQIERFEAIYRSLLEPA